MAVTLKDRRSQLEEVRKLIETDLEAEPFATYKQQREEFMDNPLGVLFGSLSGRRKNEKKLPDLPKAPTLKGDSHAEYVPKMEALADRERYIIVYAKPHQKGLGGETNGPWRAIFVSSDAEPNGKLEILIHELAHVLVTQSGKREWGQPREEVLVSTVTALCLKSIGIDWEKESACYAALYALEADGYADILVEPRTANLAHRIATELEEALQS